MFVRLLLYIQKYPVVVVFFSPFFDPLLTVLRAVCAHTRCVQAAGFYGLLFMNASLLRKQGSREVGEGA